MDNSARHFVRRNEIGKRKAKNLNGPFLQLAAFFRIAIAARERLCRNGKA
jgi:hypothetical protein